jgi:hypothetical protein
MARVWGDYIGVARRSVRFGSDSEVEGLVGERPLCPTKQPN